ncbi:hypothetical protein [Chitinophaga filiformis]|uniref:Uncharacterized protein n=1 Tax=Chitinophaga filiformis TaxID=104663 RepID=A0A1G7MF61_CHIFI|nr:hypothetical protein [Chitinophaga filiformis]SDF59820.1 hypothetical protein SAMN04488121_102383 [Chitinophaga filiformis]
MNEKELVGVLLDTVLSAPGMAETVKIDLKISRKNALLLGNLISKGIDPKSTNGLLDSMPKEAAEQLTEVSNEIIQKSGLTDLNQKLKSLTSK